jgi:glutathione synthase/RimK-type ligase-like ATP-grasp enzyme
LHHTIAFLTTDDLEDFFVWDNLLIAPFAERGISVETISWHAKDIDWSRFTAVIVRSTWDYQDDAESFMAKLAEIEKSGTSLLNPLTLMQWNVSKDYLQTLEQQGVEIIPSQFFQQADTALIQSHFVHFETDELIIKPLISANSDNTFRLTPTALADQSDDLNMIFETTPCVIQPFLNSVVDEGEYSLFYFNGQYSHTIKKVPKQGDFRVQEEHGGQLHTVQPDAALLDTAEHVLNQLPELSLYARIDLLRSTSTTPHTWQLMEVELIEPSLYFNMDEDSPERFVQATLDYLQLNAVCHS